MPLLLAIALQAAVAAPASTDDIVVYGKRLADAYRVCAAGGCTALRDAQVSIAMAEQQVRDGAYLKAKKTMAAAVDRNRDRAATDPRPVAALYEAYATVSLHEGDTDTYRKAVGGQVRTLRENLPADDPARRDAALATCDMWATLGNGRTAAAVYAAAERQALAAGDARGALLARLRRAWIAAARNDMGEARRLLREAETGPAASDPSMTAVLRVIALRIAARDADDASVDRLVGEIGHAATVQPALIWAPPYELSADVAARRDAAKFDLIDPVPPRSSDVGTIQWVDVGFWIRPDGRTRDAEVLRGVGNRTWTPALLRQIGSRRYTGIADATGDGVYRIERFTNRGTYVVPAGSNIRRRSGARELEVLDLTATPPADRAR